MALLIGDLLTDAAAVRPRAAAATLGEAEVTYGDLDRSANRTANALAGLGITAGDPVAWWTVPALRALDGFAGAARLGAPFTPLNPALGAPEAAAALEYLAPRVLVVDAAHAEAGAELARGVNALLAVVDGPGPGVDLDAATAAASASPPSPSRPIDEHDTQIIYLTSGTTGRPKGVMVSHQASWLRSFPGGSTFAVGLKGDGGILPSFPLFHYGGWHYVLEAWHYRCAIHLAARFDGPGLLDIARRRRPTAMYCIPAVWARVLDAADAPDDLESVRHADTGTSATPMDFLERLRRRVPQATTSVLYGSTEGGHHTTLADWDVARKPGSVGRVAPPGVLTLSPEGEILYRGPTLMTGYLDRPEETAQALAGGWYHTGDLGTIDDEGYLHITGRAREIIRTGGESVAPPEVETALATYPGIRDTAVIGVPDERWGEVVCAVVVLEAGIAPPDVDSLRDHVADVLAPFKHPRRVVVVEAIPRTAATGQVQRALLREQVAIANASNDR